MNQHENKITIRIKSKMKSTALRPLNLNPNLNLTPKNFRA